MSNPTNPPLLDYLRHVDLGDFELAPGDVSKGPDTFTLRDLFAAFAMSGIMSRPVEALGTPDTVAEDAGSVADAMLRERVIPR